MKIAIIGCGNMGGNLARRLSQNNQLFLYDHHPEKLDQLKEYGKVCQTLPDALKETEMIILAVKPQSIKQTAEELKAHVHENQILVSLLAGIPLKALKIYFPSLQIVRMMPNIPLIIGEGMIGLSSNEKIKNSPLDKTFEPLGKLHWLPEEKMDAFTALAGSGPAFVLVLMEAMIDAGIAMGFNHHEAKEVACQMVQGTAALLDQSSKSPGELKWQITSPQGTTIAGLQKLEEHALRGGVIDTFLATFERAKQLH